MCNLISTARTRPRVISHLLLSCRRYCILAQMALFSTTPSSDLYLNLYLCTGVFESLQRSIRATCVELDRYDENLKYTAVYTVSTKCSLF